MIYLKIVEARINCMTFCYSAGLVADSLNKARKWTLITGHTTLSMINANKQNNLAAMTSSSFGPRTMKVLR